MFEVTIATHAAMPDGSTDDRLLADALRAAGARVRLSVWNDSAVDWAQSGRIVIRSTWDYHLEPAAWFLWLSAASAVSRVINDPGVVRWNSDKRYLLDLERAGVAIVPTVLATREGPVDLGILCAERGWQDVVVKPSVGASAKGAERFAGGAIAGAGQAHLEALLARGDALVQPFQPAVQRRARTLAGLPRRCLLARLHQAAVPARHRRRPRRSDPRAVAGGAALAAQALGAAPGATTYARVDLVPTPDGPRLMELELIEPDLGLRLHPPSIAALVAAILA